MNVEIEAKLKVKSHRPFEKRLRSLAAKFQTEQKQIDFYFDDANRSFVKSDSCLRLRRQIEKSGEKIFLAYKGPKQKSNFKKRQEVEIEVGDFDKTKGILEVLGYRRVIVVEKTRMLWKVNRCLVALDKVKRLGNFIEIEGSSNKRIKQVQKLLGLGNFVHIKQSYADLLSHKISKRIQI